MYALGDGSFLSHTLESLEASYHSDDRGRENGALDLRECSQCVASSCEEENATPLAFPAWIRAYHHEERVKALFDLASCSCGKTSCLSCSCARASGEGEGSPSS